MSSALPLKLCSALLRCAIVAVSIVALVGLSASAQAQQPDPDPPPEGGEPTPPGPGPGPAFTGPAAPPFQLEDLIWVDRTTGLLAGELSRIAIHPDTDDLIFIAGRGFISRSVDGGVTWEPSLLLFEGEVVSGDDDVEISADDLELFDDAAAGEEFDELREEAFEELAEQYGEDLAEELIIDIEDEIEQDVFDRLANEAELELNERLGNAREERLKKAGFDSDDASGFAQDPLAIYRLHIPSSAPRTVFAATGSGLFRSLDNGRRWRRILNPAAGEGIVFDVAAVDLGRTIIAGTDEGLLVSDDAGRTFTPVNAVVRDPIRLVLASPSEDYLFAIGIRRIYRSADNGASWESFVPAFFSPDDILHIASDAGDPDILIAAATDGVYRSDDAGESWTPLPTTNLAATALRQVLLPDGDADRIVALSENDIAYSIDGGNTWNALETGLIGQSMSWLSATDKHLWLATEVGLLEALPAADFSLVEETLRLLRAQWAREPSPADTIGAALLYAQLLEVYEAEWSTRVRLAKFAPRFQLRFEMRRQRTGLNYGTFQYEDDNRDRDLANLGQETRRVDIRDWSCPGSVLGVGDSPICGDFRIFAWWNVGRMLYDPVENRLESVARQRRKDRRKLATSVVKIVMKRRSLQMRLAGSVGLTLDEDLDIRLQIEELTALLDALTGGFFTTATAQP